MLVCLGDRFAAVGRFGHHLEAVLTFEQEAQASAHNPVIVGQQDADVIHESACISGLPGGTACPGRATLACAGKSACATLLIAELGFDYFVFH